MAKIHSPYTKVGRLKSTELLIEGANNTELSGLPIYCKYAAELPMFMDLFYNPFQNIERCIKAETDPNKIDFLKGRQTSIYKDYKKHLQIEFHRAQLKYEMTNNQGDGFSTRAIAFEQDKISVGVFYRDLANKMLNHKKHISLLFLFEMSLLTKRLHPDAYIGS